MTAANLKFSRKKNLNKRTSTLKKLSQRRGIQFYISEEFSTSSEEFQKTEDDYSDESCNEYLTDTDGHVMDDESTDSNGSMAKASSYAWKVDIFFLLKARMKEIQSLWNS